MERSLYLCIISLMFFCCSPKVKNDKVDVYKNSAIASFVDSISNITYKQVEDSAITLNIYSHKDDTLKSRPTLIYIHGGAWIHGNKFWIWKHYRQAVAESFIKAGYVVVSVDYRLADGIGHDVLTEFEDCKDAVYWIRKNAGIYGIDSQRIGLWGTSAGGHLSLLVGNDLADSIPIRYIIDDYGPTDINRLLYTWLPDFAVSIAKVFKPNLIHKRTECINAFNGDETLLSPVNVINKNTPPILISQGSEDKTVPKRQSLRLARKLKKNGVTHDIRIYEGESHVLGELSYSEVESHVKRAISFADSCNAVD